MARLFLATANVGSVFENMEEGLERWLDKFLEAVQEHSPNFIAIHFQECGGKNYQNCTNEIRVFFAELKRRFEELKFFQIEGFVDSQAEIVDQFTALANVYFLHKDLSTNNVQIWNFKEKLFAPVSTDHPLHIGEELKNTERKQKEKFPQHFFPDFKWSRKGFLQTRWRINGVVIDLVNCHLFHDSCNLIAGSAFPSPFAQNRLKTLNYTLDKLLQDDVATFIFGDFNFRLNTYEIFDILRRQHTDQDDSTRKPAAENDNELAIDSKYFSCPDQEQRFKHDFHWLRQYEFEAAQFHRLSEWALNFHPSYPFDESLPDKFMRTRCPAWCDRVLFTHNAKSVISNASESQPPPVYHLVGTNVCMGDHKPVYLSFTLQSDKESLQSDDDVKKSDNNEAVGDNVTAVNTEDKNCCQVEMEDEKSVDSIKSNRRKCKCLVSFFRKSLISKGKRRHGSGDLENNSVLLNSADCDLENKCPSPDTQVAQSRIKLQSSSSSGARNGNRGGENSNNNCQEIRQLNSNSRYNSIFKKKYSKWKSKECTTTTTHNEQSITSSSHTPKSGSNSKILPTDDKSNNSNASTNNIKLAKITSPPQALDSQDLCGLLPHMITDSDTAKLRSLDDNEEPECLALSFDRLSLNHSASNSINEVQDEFQPCTPNTTNDNEKSGQKLRGKNRTKLFRLSRKKKGRSNVRKQKHSNQNNLENESTSAILCNKCVIL